MKRFIFVALALFGLAYAGTPVEIHFTSKGPQPVRLHIPTDQPYDLILVNDTQGQIRLTLAPEKVSSPAEREFAERFFNQGPVVLEGRARKVFPYWPTKIGIVHLRVEGASAKYLLEFIFEPPEYYEGPSGCS